MVFRTVKQENGKLTSKTQEELDKYNKGWASFMVHILEEQIDKLNVSDTKALYSSIQELISIGTVTTIEHKFLMYGIYVAAGVGNSFLKSNNNGNLLFMSDEYRQAHGEYQSRQVGVKWSDKRMLSPKFKRVVIKKGKNKGKEAALTSGEKRKKRDWFFRKYYYSLHRLNSENSKFYGYAYQGMTSSFLESLFADISSGTRIRSNRF